MCTAFYMIWLFGLGMAALIARGTDDSKNSEEYLFLAIMALVPGVVVFFLWRASMRNSDE
jgi:hypothetical protein